MTDTFHPLIHARLESVQEFSAISIRKEMVHSDGIKILRARLVPRPDGLIPARSGDLAGTERMVPTNPKHEAP